MELIKRYLAIALVALISVVSVIQFHHHDCKGDAHINLAFTIHDPGDTISDNHNHNCCHGHTHQCDDSACSLRISASTDIQNESIILKTICPDHVLAFYIDEQAHVDFRISPLYEINYNYEMPFSPSIDDDLNRYRGSPYFA